MSNLIAPALSLAAAVSWGAADFSGGFASKTTNAFRVVVMAHATGLLFMLALALFSREPLPGERVLLFGAAAGMVGGIGLAAFYRSLAIGKMGINAPLSAVITALLPLGFSFVTEGLPGAVRIAGFGLALISIWVIAAPHATSERQQGIGLAFIAGIGFGGFLLLMKLAGGTAVFWPLAAARTASSLLMLVIVLLSRAARQSSRGALRYIIVAGILDSAANALYVAAAHRGRLDSAAVLSSLYPAATVILARLVLQERWSRLQAFGMVAALLAVVLISI